MLSASQADKVKTEAALRLRLAADVAGEEVARTARVWLAGTTCTHELRGFASTTTSGRSAIPFSCSAPAVIFFRTARSCGVIETKPLGEAVGRSGGALNVSTSTTISWPAVRMR